MHDQEAPRPSAKKVMSVPEFARAVGTGQRRVREYIHAGLVRSVRHGRHIVIPVTEVDAFLERAST